MAQPIHAQADATGQFDPHMQSTILNGLGPSATMIGLAGILNWQADWPISWSFKLLLDWILRLVQSSPDSSADASHCTPCSK
jgi:hypothetical protein